MTFTPVRVESTVAGRLLPPDPERHCAGLSASPVAQLCLFHEEFTAPRITAKTTAWSWCCIHTAVTQGYFCGCCRGDRWACYRGCWWLFGWDVWGPAVDRGEWCLLASPERPWALWVWALQSIDRKQSVWSIRVLTWALCLIMLSLHDSSLVFHIF